MPQDNCSKPGESSVCLFSEKSADRAVKRTFAILGVDVDDPKQVAEFQEDLRFGSMMRKIANRGVLAIIGAVCIGLAAATWAGIVKVVNGQ